MKYWNTFQKKWITLDEKYFSKVELGKLKYNTIKNPVKFFPVKIELNKKETDFLKSLELQKSWKGDEFLTLHKLKVKRGISLEHFDLFKEDLKLLNIQCKNKEIRLPNWFFNFFNNYDYLSRFRFRIISFYIGYGLIPFPEDDNYYLIPFLGDSQGFNWWGIMIDKNNEYCIVYRDLFWLENPEENESKEYGEYYYCSNTFEEFLRRLSFDLKENEKRNELNIY